MSYNDYSVKKVITEILKSEEELPFKTITKKYPKGTIILEPGGRFQENYYIKSGIIELSAVSPKDNQEMILEFVFPDEFLGAFSFYVYKPASLYYVKCLTDCTLEIIPIKEFLTTLETSLLVNKLGRYILEFWFLKRIRKEKDMMLKTSEELYNDLIATRAEVIQQIPVSKIAKYLGIHPDSLSRIRRKVHS